MPLGTPVRWSDEEELEAFALDISGFATAGVAVAVVFTVVGGRGLALLGGGGGGAPFLSFESFFLDEEELRESWASREGSARCFSFGVLID